MGLRRRGSDLGTRTLGFPQHPDEHRPERPVLLAADEELSERSGNPTSAPSPSAPAFTGHAIPRRSLVGDAHHPEGRREVLR
jgi:hypothetical protein